jgi:hypothetical protein
VSARTPFMPWYARAIGASWTWACDHGCWLAAAAAFGVGVGVSVTWFFGPWGGK